MSFDPEMIGAFWSGEGYADFGAVLFLVVLIGVGLYLWSAWHLWRGRKSARDDRDDSG